MSAEYVPQEWPVPEQTPEYSKSLLRLADGLLKEEREKVEILDAALDDLWQRNQELHDELDAKTERIKTLEEYAGGLTRAARGV